MKQKCFILCDKKIGTTIWYITSIEIYDEPKSDTSNNSTPWVEPTSSGQPYSYKLSKATSQIIGYVKLEEA